jgi:hypothetical protein
MKDSPDDEVNHDKGVANDIYSDRRGRNGSECWEVVLHPRVLDTQRLRNPSNFHGLYININIP